MHTIGFIIYPGVYSINTQSDVLTRNATQVPGVTHNQSSQNKLIYSQENKTIINKNILFLI